jgi:prevent-host-death family protein
MRGAGRADENEIVVNVHEAKTHFSKLLRRVQSGQSVVIAKASKPIARIVPLTEAAPEGRVFGAFKGWIGCEPDAFEMSDDMADLFEGEGLLPK